MQQSTNANADATNEVNNAEETSLVTHGVTFPQTVTCPPLSVKDSAATSLRTDFTAMKKSALRERAQRLGASGAALHEADDADDTKAAFIELILAHEATAPRDFAIGDTVSVAGRQGVVRPYGRHNGSTHYWTLWLDDGTESDIMREEDLVLVAKAPQYNHSQQLVDEKKNKLLRHYCGKCTLTIIITIVSAGALLYLGFMVKAANTCGRGEIISAHGVTFFDNSTSHWKSWYRVAGFMIIFHGFLRLSMLIASFPSDERVRLEVFKEPCKDEKFKFIYEASFPGLEENLECLMAIHGGIQVLALMFDFGWMIYGVIIYFQTKAKCTLMTQCFLYVVMYLFIMLITTFFCASSSCASGKDDNGYEAIEEKHSLEEGLTNNVVNTSVDSSVND